MQSLYQLTTPPADDPKVLKWKKVMQVGMIESQSRLGGIYDQSVIEANYAVCEDKKIHRVEMIKKGLPIEEDPIRRWVDGGARFRSIEKNGRYGSLECVYLKISRPDSIKILYSSDDIKRDPCSERDEAFLRYKDALFANEKILKCIRLERPEELPMFKLITFVKDKCFARYPVLKGDQIRVSSREVGTFKPDFRFKTFCSFGNVDDPFGEGSEDDYAYSLGEHSTKLLKFKVGKDTFELFREYSREGSHLELLQVDNGKIPLQSYYLYSGYDIAPVR